MKILVIGSGGREHALAWKLAQSPRVSEVIVAPGNAGSATEGKCRNVAIKVNDIEGLLKLAQDEAVGLTVVGPEVPLVLALSIVSAKPACAFSGRPLLPRSWKAARPSPRISSPVTAFPPRTTPCIRKWMRRWPTCMRRARPS